MPILKPLAPVVLEENEVTDGRTVVMPFWPDPYAKILISPSPCVGGIKAKPKSLGREGLSPNIVCIIHF